MVQLTGGLGGFRKQTGLVEALGIVELVVVDLWMQLHQLLIAVGFVGMYTYVHHSFAFAQFSYVMNPASTHKFPQVQEQNNEL